MVAPAPTITSPTEAQSIAAFGFNLVLTLNAYLGAGHRQWVRYEIANDSGFTQIISNKTSYTTRDEGQTWTFGGGTITADDIYDIGPNGTKYIRAAAKDENEGSWGAWSATRTITINAPAISEVPVLTASYNPADGAIISDPDFRMQIWNGAAGNATPGRTLYPKWEAARDSGFSSGYRGYTDVNYAAAVYFDWSWTTVTRYWDDVGSPLSPGQGVWYWRVRYADAFGAVGTPTTARTVTINHLPSTTAQTPTGDQYIVWGATNRLSWTFSDPWTDHAYPYPTLDVQTAFQVIVERNDTGAAVLDSGKISSVNKYWDAAIPGALKDIAGSLRWKVRVWDIDDLPSGYSAWFLFRVSDLPQVTITAPTADQVLVGGRPTITWTVDASTTQVNYRVRVYKVSDDSLIHDSGVVVSAVKTYMPANPILESDIPYYLTVTVVDTQTFSGTSANRTFSAHYSAPANVVVTSDISNFDVLGYVPVDWSQNNADATWISWKVYRREVGVDIDWQFILETTNVNLRSYQDWNLKTGHTYEYAVTQTADRLGVTLESIPTPPAAVLIATTNYWLINPYDPAYNLLLSNVTDDGYTDEIEQESYVVIGRGRRTDYGTVLGKSGSMSAQLRNKTWATAREQKEALEAVIRQKSTYYLRTPFGDMYQISLGNVSVSRIAGVGVTELVDIQLPYTEVF